jgi:hypothetical protein
MPLSNKFGDEFRPHWGDLIKSNTAKLNFFGNAWLHPNRRNPIA